MASPLVAALAERIRQAGRISFYEWMTTALYDPTLGYYSRPELERWGRKGDYRTSPERSELFAATFTRYFVSLFEREQLPDQFVIVEMGAGDGHFASVVLRTLQQQYPRLFAVTKYVISEVSADARKRAVIRLDHYSDQIEFLRVEDLDRLEFGIFFSNELLDAFPVHRLTNVDGQLKELFVTLDDNDQFTWVEGELSTEAIRDSCREHLPPLKEGQVVELNTDIAAWLKNISEKLKSGYLVTVDYGATADDLYGQPHREKGTLRGFRRHHFVNDILQSPGDNDITTTIDWTLVMNEGEKCGFRVQEFASLDSFLLRGGVLEELAIRMVNCSEAAKAELTVNARDMILPGGMASSFQVLVQRRQ